MVKALSIVSVAEKALKVKYKQRFLRNGKGALYCLRSRESPESEIQKEGYFSEMVKVLSIVSVVEKALKVKYKRKDVFFRNGKRRSLSSPFHKLLH